MNVCIPTYVREKLEKPEKLEKLENLEKQLNSRLLRAKFPVVAKDQILVVEPKKVSCRSIFLESRP